MLSIRAKYIHQGSEDVPCTACLAHPRIPEATPCVIHDVEHHLFGHSVPVCGVGSLPKETDYAPVAKDYCMDGTGWPMGQPAMPLVLSSSSAYWI